MASKSTKETGQSAAKDPSQKKSQKGKPEPVYLILTAIIVILIAASVVILFTRNNPQKAVTPVIIISAYKGSVGSTCISASSFLCAHASYSYNTSNISMTFEQTTGMIWNSAKLAFVMHESGANITSQVSPNSSIWQSAYAIPGTLVPGQRINVSIHAPALANVPAGQTPWGSLWAEYMFNSSSPVRIVNVGEFYIGTISQP